MLFSDFINEDFEYNLSEKHNRIDNNDEIKNTDYKDVNGLTQNDVVYRKDMYLLVDTLNRYMDNFSKKYNLDGSFKYIKDTPQKITHFTQTCSRIYTFNNKATHEMLEDLKKFAGKYGLVLSIEKTRKMMGLISYITYGFWVEHSAGGHTYLMGCVTFKK